MSFETRTRRGRACPAGAVAAQLLFVPLAVALAACGGEQPAAAPQVRPVRVERVAATGAGRLATFTGVARAGVESRLSFRVAGTVVELPLQVGGRVRRGQVLARLDPVDYELRVEEAEAALAQARAAARNADASYDRVRELYENANASKGDLDAARAGAESAAAQVEAGSKRLAQARQQVGYTVLRAPLDGACAEVHVEVNENVNAGQPVATLTAGELPEVEVAVPQASIADVAAGMPARVAFDTLPGRDFAATVIEVAVATLGASPTYPVRVRLDDDLPAVRPGMAAEVSLRFGADGERRILVPPVAVVEDRQGRCAFVVESDGAAAAGAAAGERLGVARRRAVTVGELTGAGLEITSGLAEGDLLVTAGARRLEDGDAVRVPAAAVDGGDGGGEGGAR